MADEIKEILSGISKDIVYGFRHSPNTLGVFEKSGKWYFYSTSPDNISEIVGPFNEKEIIYTVAKAFCVTDRYEEYKCLREDDNKVFHYQNILEIP